MRLSQTAKTKKCLWARPAAAVICGYKHRQREGNLMSTSCTIRKITAVSSPLGPMTYNGLLTRFTVTGEEPSSAAGLSSSQRAVGRPWNRHCHYCTSGCILLGLLIMFHAQSIAEWDCCCQFFPTGLGLIDPSNTMRASSCLLKWHFLLLSATYTAILTHSFYLIINHRYTATH